MRLTLYTDYALRVLIYLGVRGDDGERATITEIAERYAISRNHVMKVVYQLGKLGYIETVRGKGGGLRMQMRPEDINVGVLVRQTEADMAIVECFSSSGRCRLAPDCRLQGMLKEALDAFMDVLDRYTLADILDNRQSLRQMLGVTT
ncbi:Rrf2 family transcriptional regulator [Methylonatrum kenyense]|uniref:RrF2 family transcriptional regulator n=1 Tax=Methylonatrum kenyense TaxID=455253 RepID=UPI0020BD8F21|nr:Rrf2 family transcriptional regulator [Methylonatrum kenyense]MCK8515836.1 Rrf2 family transcriptional regulator [Methylonatrum kenyense]